MRPCAHIAEVERGMAHGRLPRHTPKAEQAGTAARIAFVVHILRVITEVLASSCCRGRRERLVAGWQQQEGPFSGLEQLSRRRAQASSWAVIDGAENLLNKALACWRDDRPRALRYVELAAKLPFDKHEECFPAAFAASSQIFSIVTDELEAAEEEDSVWLEAALRTLDQAGTSARFQLRDTLAAIEMDYEISDRERRQLRAAIEPIPPRPELRDLTGLSVDQLRDEVAEILEACLAYEEAVAQILDETMP